MMNQHENAARPRLALGFEVAEPAARRLRGLGFLRAMTEGRAQTRLAASGEGFRNHRILRPEPSTRVEMMLSVGPAVPGAEQEELVGRLRLTLLNGSVDALVELVQRFHAAISLRLIATLPEPAPLDPEGSTESALATILRARLTDLSHQQNEAASTGAVAAVHQTRVALRRLRAAVALFKPVLPSTFSSHINDEARWLASMLSPVRDWDVFLNDSLPPFAARLADDPGFDALKRLAVQARDQAAVEMAVALHSPRCLSLQVTLELAIQRRLWRDQEVNETAAALFAPLTDTAPTLLDRLWRGVRRDGKRFASGGAEASHDLRKKIKKLRYAIEFFSEVYSRRDLRGYLSDLAQMQQRLGVANDAAVAQALIKDLVHARPTAALIRTEGFIAGWLACEWKDVPPDAVESWRRLRSTPKFWQESSIR
jgi:CHAD domain-containing protein